MPKLSFFIFCLMFFALSFGVAAMAALVPSVAVDFDVIPEQAIKLTWLYMLPYGLVALIWGPLSRGFKLRRLLLAVSSGFFLSSLGFSLSGTIKQAFLFRFLMGSFGCGFVPLAFITIGKSIKARDKSRYIGALFAVSYLSTFISVFLSGFLYWRFIYLVPAFLSLVVFILVLTCLHDFDFRSKAFKISYYRTFRDKKALRLFLVIMASSFFYHSLQQRLGLYLSEYFSLKQFIISLIFTVSTFSSIGAEFLGGFFASRFGNVRIARFGFFLMAGFCLLLFGINDYRFLFAAIFLWGSGWSLTHVGISTYLTGLKDSVLRDASSLNSALRFSFGGLGAFAGGLLATSIGGFHILFVIVAASVLMLGLFLGRILLKQEAQAV